MRQVYRGIPAFLSACLFFAVFSLTVRHLQASRPGERGEQRSGAMEALEFWARSRAFPDNDIPPDKYYKAFIASKKRMKKLPAQILETNGGWSSIGPLNLSGRCLSVAVNPMNSGTVYVGSASGGLWRSTNGGTGGDWQRVATGYPVLSVSSIAISPADSNVIYIGTGEVYRYQGAQGGLIVRTTRGSYGIGILKTTDGGKSWVKALDWSTNQQRGVQAVRINPLNPSSIWAATTEGVYRTVDAGSSWEPMLSNIQAEDLLINTADTNMVLVSYGNFGRGPGVVNTLDNGVIWGSCPLPFFSGKTLLAASGSDPYTVFASVADSTTGVATLWRSTDFGLSWTQRHDFTSSGWYGVQGWYSHYVAVHPTNPNSVVVGAVNMGKSTDGGSTFFGSGGTYSDHHGYASDPNNPEILFDANDNGIYRSDDFGDSFTWTGYGLVTGQFYNGFSCSSSDPVLSIGQSQDHIPGYRYTGSAAWGRSATDEAGWTATNPKDDNYMYAVSRFGQSVVRSTNRGVSFTSRTSFGGDAAWNSPVIISPAFPSVLYFAKNQVYKSTDAGTSWLSTTGFPVADGNFAISIGMSFTNPDTVYVGKGPYAGRARLYRTVDGGSSWQEITGTLPNRYPLDIAVDPNNSRIVYATFGGFGSGHVFKSTNAGVAWTDASAGLPDCPVTAAVVDPLNSNYVYLGTDVGVMVSTDAGTSWNDFSEGFTDAVLISDLVISPSNRKLRAVTHGNGVFERDMPATLPFLELLAPNGGEEWDAGSVQSIAWSEGGVGTLRIEYSTDNGTGWTTVASGVTPASGSYHWTVPLPLANQARVRISSETQPGVSAVSAAPFAITFQGASVTANAGWNLLSLPVDAPNPTQHHLFPESLSPAFAYEGSTYVARETLSVGTGYWMKFAGSVTEQIRGTTVGADTVSVGEGWNLLGSVSGPVVARTVGSDPPGLTTSQFFGFAGAYYRADTILPGRGYWVKTAGAGTLIFSSTAALPAAGTIHMVASSDLPPAPPPLAAGIGGAVLPPGRGMPAEFSLAQNYPNPFNPATQIEFQVPDRAPAVPVTLGVYDIRGQQVAMLVDETIAPGTYRFTWNAAGLPSGVYYATLRAGGAFRQTRKMLLIR